ncbi:uncharacterized protein FTJAE_6962 [Fusarium tjaetaba]|uniref:Uncharacterized protein n=1 Tax=Fusarium tjaetaba TaxID=1567544 RepID=A0A8H5VSC4_9HYPO|nr:uncharacterized protein FTJAE_6962 [Fusarium tjaetaba]KAF5633811.1 hypothetical protein FTJAE_6962 [Fusarium tjaetaba]
MESSHWQGIRFCDTSKSLNENERTGIIERIWYSEKKLEPGDTFGYFEFLRREQLIRDIIYSNANASRTNLWAKVRVVLPVSIPDDEIDRIITIMIRLFLMIRVKFCDSRVYVPPNQLPFLRNQSLFDVLKNFQNGRLLSDFNMADRYPLWFNAVDLEKKAGLEIGWTDYITEHLTIQGKMVLLFRHIEALKYLEQSEAMTLELFSRNFITETMCSILLFFPTKNGGPVTLQDYNKRFLSQEDPESCLTRLINKDSWEVKEVTRLFQDYPVWHQRLAYILEIAKNPTDWSFKRLWYDDREESLWWARWALITAVFLAIIFGLIQSITGIIQVIGCLNLVSAYPGLEDPGNTSDVNMGAFDAEGITGHTSG